MIYTGMHNITNYLHVNIESVLETVDAEKQMMMMMMMTTTMKKIMTIKKANYDITENPPIVNNSRGRNTSIYLPIHVLPINSDACTL